MKVPQNIRAHISNARYYLEAAERLPSPVSDGVRILLLLTAWENLHIATTELRARVWAKPIPKELYRDHEFKFQEVRGPIIQLIPTGGKLIEKAHSSPTELRKLLETCRYGPQGGSRELRPYFSTRWFTDEFEKNLYNNLGWIEVQIKIYDKIEEDVREEAKTRKRRR